MIAPGCTHTHAQLWIIKQPEQRATKFLRVCVCDQHTSHPVRHNLWRRSRVQRNHGARVRHCLKKHNPKTLRAARQAEYCALVIKYTKVSRCKRARKLHPPCQIELPRKRLQPCAIIAVTHNHAVRLRPCIAHKCQCPQQLVDALVTVIAVQPRNRQYQVVVSGAGWRRRQAISQHIGYHHNFCGRHSMQFHQPAGGVYAHSNNDVRPPQSSPLHTGAQRPDLHPMRHNYIAQPWPQQAHQPGQRRKINMRHPDA